MPMPNEKSTSLIDALPYARSAWLCMTEGEQCAVRLGMVPTRMMLNFAKISHPDTFKKALILISQEAQ